MATGHRTSAEPLLRVEDLTTDFQASRGLLRVVDGVSFEVRRGETVGIVGESGCGKSVTALSILRLVPEPGRITGGRILFGPRDEPRDIVRMTDAEVRDLRGNDIAMIFQDPMTSLNPVLTVGHQIKEAMAVHRRFTPRQAGERVVPMLERVRMLAPKQHAVCFPKELSGGMRQRAMIAMGLSNEPSLLIADEPTAALDVTVQAQMIELLRDLNRETGTAIVLITHDLAVVASLCTHVIVMYAGRVIEQGPTRQVFKSPQHPYTWSLLRCLPRVDGERREMLTSIAGLPPDLGRPPPGCRFHPRCRFRVARCLSDEPPLEPVAAAQDARCWVPMRSGLNGVEDSGR
jgi:oligopeptide/dipeptide ABC transporter ATP-binding protein